MDQPRCFLLLSKHCLILLKIQENAYLINFGIFLEFARYLNNHTMALQYFGSGPTRGLLKCFSCIFLLMVLLHKSTKFNFLKKSPTPMISRKNSVKGDNCQDNTLTELEIDFTNISVLREVMIKG